MRKIDSERKGESACGKNREVNREIAIISENLNYPFHREFKMTR